MFYVECGRGCLDRTRRRRGAAELPPFKAGLGHQIHQVTDANLAYLARYGVEGISAAATITDPARIFATAEEMTRLRETVENTDSNSS